MPDLPYGLGCPSCAYYVEVSDEDPDANLSDLHNHVFIRHAGFDQSRANDLLAKARDLSKAEAVAR